MDFQADVLIIDDDEGARLTIKHMVESARYQVRTATGGHDALEKMVARSVVISLGSLSGTQTLQHPVSKI